jgi:hypothetical protein
MICINRYIHELHVSQRRETIKYDHESRESKKQGWLCWREQAAVYLTYRLLQWSLVLYECVESEVLTAVVMKSRIFWDINPCSPLKVKRHFGETYRLHLQHQISWVKCQRESRWQTVPPKRWLTFNGLHDIMSQKIAILLLYDPWGLYFTK